jgi:hypothetical protein
VTSIGNQAHPRQATVFNPKKLLAGFASNLPVWQSIWRTFARFVSRRFDEDAGVFVSVAVRAYEDQPIRHYLESVSNSRCDRLPEQGCDRPENAGYRPPFMFDHKLLA